MLDTRFSVSGFSLIEVIIALSLISVLSVGLTQGLIKANQQVAILHQAVVAQL